MATTNVTAGGTWVKVADAGTNFLITGPFLLDESKAFEVFSVLVDVAPAETLIGHSIVPALREGCYREDIGAGYIYARAIGMSSMVLAVTVY